MLAAEDGEDIINIEADNPTKQPSAIVLKSDELRIIARKQDGDMDPDHPGGPTMNGSIRLIKEGLPNEDLAMICLLKDGTIQISGSRIFLGRNEADEGRGGGYSEPSLMPSGTRAGECGAARAPTIVPERTTAQ